MLFLALPKKNSLAFPQSLYNFEFMKFQY